jgi:hypothetical protein
MAEFEGIISKYNNMPVKVRKQYYNYEETAKELKKKFDGMNKLIDMNIKMREEIGDESYYHNAEKEVDQDE